MAKRPVDRRWLAIGVAAVVGWAGFAVYAAGDAGDDERVPAATVEEVEKDAEPGPSRPRRTTTTTAPGTPLLGEPTGLVLVLVGTGVRAFDVDTGVATRLRIGNPVVVQRGGVVSQDARGGFTYHPFPFDGGAGRPLGGGDIAMGSTGIDGVWIGDQGDNGDVRWRLVGADGGIHGEVDVFAKIVVRSATSDGLIASAGGRIFQFTPQGVRDLGPGELFSASEGWLFVHRCDETGRCRIDRQHVTGETLPMPEPTLGEWRSYGYAVDPFGRTAAISETVGSENDLSFVVTVVRPDGSVESTVPIAPGHDPQLTWSPDGRWLLSTDGSGSLFAIDTHDYSLHEIAIGPNSYLAGVLQSER